MALVKMQEQFNGLPLQSLIGGPLQAAVDSQTMLAYATADFIQNVGFTKPTRDNNGIITAQGDVVNVTFEYVQTTQDAGSGATTEETMEITVPLLSIVPIPNLQVDVVDIIFDMEVKSSETSVQGSDTEIAAEVEASAGWGPFKVRAKVSGKVATHKENTRSSDNSARYHVEVHASNHGYPEGLARVMDMIAASITPKAKS